MKATTKVKVPHFEYSTIVDIEVEISPDALHRDGWHHKSECPATDAPSEALPQRPLIIGGITCAEAIGSLHRQAHPRQSGDPLTCPEEPCRSLSLAQLRGEA